MFTNFFLAKLTLEEAYEILEIKTYIIYYIPEVSSKRKKINITTKFL